MSYAKVTNDLKILAKSLLLYIPMMMQLTVSMQRGLNEESHSVFLALQQQPILLTEEMSKKSLTHLEMNSQVGPSGLSG